MTSDLKAVLGLGVLMLLIVWAGLPNLRAQDPLPAHVAGLFPSNVINSGGVFVKTPVMRVDISGDVPNTRACGKGSLAGVGSMRIELSFFNGPRAALIRTYVKNLPNLIEQDRASLTPAPVHDETIGGETALWVEETTPCVEAATPTAHSVIMKCQFVKGEIYGKIAIGFYGDVDEAKAMLSETLDKISKTDWSK